MTGSPTSGALRIARCTALVVIAFTLAAVAHTLSGGDLPGVGALAALLVPVACLTFLVTARKVGTALTLTFMGGLQFLLHQAFSLFGGHGQSSTPILLTTGSGHLHTAMVSWGPPPPPATTHVAMAAHAGWDSPGALAMLALHALATALTAAALARSEQALWAMWSWLQPLFAPRSPVGIFAPHRRVSLIDAHDSRPVTEQVQRHRRRRGPPAMGSSLLPH